MLGVDVGVAVGPTVAGAAPLLPGCPPEPLPGGQFVVPPELPHGLDGGGALEQANKTANSTAIAMRMLRMALHPAMRVRGQELHREIRGARRHVDAVTCPYLFSIDVAGGNCRKRHVELRDLVARLGSVPSQDTKTKAKREGSKGDQNQAHLGPVQDQND
jgi:hypothetical protein